MTTRLTLNVPDTMNAALERIAGEEERSKTEIIRKALALYAMARDAQAAGQQIGFADPVSKIIQTPVVL